MQDIRHEIAALVPRLRRFAWSLCGNRADADDLVQAACLRALERTGQFTPGTRLDAWMFRILRSIRIDRARAEGRRGTQADPEELEHVSDQGLGARLVEDRLTLERVREAMTLLPEAQREVLALVCIEGYSYRDAAEVLGVPTGTVMSRLSRARQNLGEALGGL